MVKSILYRESRSEPVFPGWYQALEPIICPAVMPDIRHALDSINLAVTGIAISLTPLMRMVARSILVGIEEAILSESVD